MKNMIEIKDDKIIFDKEFFNKAFVSYSIQLNKPLSSLSLRLMAILLQELSFYEERKIPPRTKLAKRLGVSTTTINNSLAELEQSRFLIRYKSKLEKIIPVDHSKKEHQSFLDYKSKQKEENRQSKRFSDFFQINYNFNKTEEEITDGIYKSFRKHLDPNLTNEELKVLLEKLLSQQHE